MATDDLYLELESAGGDDYRLEIEWRRSDDDRSTRFDPTLIQIDWQEARERAITRDMEAFGLWLGDEILFGQPDARSAFDTAFGGARIRERPLRLRLDLGEAPQTLPWETLRLSDHGTLATNERLLVSRYLQSSDVRGAGRPAPADEWQVGLLVANPDGLAERGLAEVNEEEILADLQEAIGPEAIQTYKATIAGIRDCLSAGLDVLCLAAHGGVKEGDGEPFVYLEREDGTIRGVTAKDLAEEFQAIEDGKLPRMVVLLSCQSGASGELDPSRESRLFLGAQLVEQGVPAVVSIQENISMETGRLFLRELFKELKEDCIVDRSLAMARRAIAQRHDWWMPVLFMNMASGRLCRPPTPSVIDQFKQLNKVAQAALVAVFLMLVVILGFVVAGFLSSQPEEEAVMTGEFNVAVAEFTALNESGQPAESEDALKMADNLFRRLENTVSGLGLEDIDYQLWPPERTGPVGGNSPEEREAAAAGLADRINADVIISGVLNEGGDSGMFVPEFYVDERGFQEAAEITGRHELGRELLVKLPFEGIADAENPALVARSKALSLMTVGLAYYALSNPETAQDYFNQALNVEGWFPNAGQEVAHLMLGKTNFLLAEQRKEVEPLVTAAAHFAAAATIEPNYERAKVGQAAVTYMLAIGDPDDPNQTIDAALLDQAEGDFVAALETEAIDENPILEARIRFGLGQIYLARFLLEDANAAWLGPAKDEFQQVMAAYEENEQLADLVGHTLAHLGRIAWLEGQRPAAVDYYEQSRHLVSPFYEAKYLSIKAEVLADMREFEGACEALELAKGISETHADLESFNRYQQQQDDLGC